MLISRSSNWAIKQQRVGEQDDYSAASAGSPRSQTHSGFFSQSTVHSTTSSSLVEDLKNSLARSLGLPPTKKQRNLSTVSELSARVSHIKFEGDDDSPISPLVVRDLDETFVRPISEDYSLMEELPLLSHIQPAGDFEGDWYYDCIHDAIPHGVVIPNDIERLICTMWKGKRTQPFRAVYFKFSKEYSAKYLIVWSVIGLLLAGVAYFALTTERNPLITLGGLVITLPLWPHLIYWNKLLGGLLGLTLVAIGSTLAFMFRQYCVVVSVASFIVIFNVQFFVFVFVTYPKIVKSPIRLAFGVEEPVLGLMYNNERFLCWRPPGNQMIHTHSVAISNIRLEKENHWRAGSVIKLKFTVLGRSAELEVMGRKDVLCEKFCRALKQTNDYKYQDFTVMDIPRRIRRTVVV